MTTKKNKTKSKLASITLLVSLGVGTSSCVTDPATIIPMGAGIGALVGEKIGGTRGRNIGAGAGALIAYAAYKASNQQRAQVVSRGTSASKRSSIQNRLNASGAKYVLVPVSSSKRSGGNDIGVFNTETKKMASSKVYRPKKSSYKAGEVARVGGYQGVVASSFQGI